MRGRGRSDGCGAQCGGTQNGDMWDNKGQSGYREHLRWQGLCIKDNEGTLGPR